MSRRALAAQIGFPDLSVGIPEARFMRAMTFERLVHDEAFVSALTTTTLGQAHLGRPSKVHRIDCGIDQAATAKALVDADMTATFAETATMLSRLALPFPGLEEEDATPVLPDFAVVAPRIDDGRITGSWLIMGDAKDYERVRARIDDGRLLKGFLQVALGAEAADRWSRRPHQMMVSPYGALAVPRNAFPRPEGLVELLTDHRAEVRARSDERIAAWRGVGQPTAPPAITARDVATIPPRFDPATCPTCSLMPFCREELRSANDRAALITEIGVPPSQRAGALAALSEPGAPTRVGVDLMARIEATEEGRPIWRQARRLDFATDSPTIDVAVAKSDAAALGIHGVSIRSSGDASWKQSVFLEPQSPATRRAVMRLIGLRIRAELDESGPVVVRIVVPDGASADLLVTAADSVAGVELSRMRWQRDLDMGRSPVNFDGSPATLADPLDADERLGAAFLLEADRARALSTRTPIVDLRTALAGTVVAGGAAINSLRLDYLVEWCTSPQPCDHRAIADDIEARGHTPGARLANSESDLIHQAYLSRASDPGRYRGLVSASLEYKQETMDAALALLRRAETSQARAVLAQLEERAQTIWRRRVDLGALDLTRFGRTPDTWRDNQTRVLDGDAALTSVLRVLVDPWHAQDVASDIGARDVANATVVTCTPLRIRISGRAFVRGDTVVALHHNGMPLAESGAVGFAVQSDQIRVGPLPAGQLGDHSEDGCLWEPRNALECAPGDSLIVARADWFKKIYANGRDVALPRPGADKSGPAEGCSAAAFASDPDAHRWCCRPHTAAEAETADYFADQRARGLMNPETWPPLVDEERFDVDGEATDDEAIGAVPEGLTMDDID